MSLTGLEVFGLRSTVPVLPLAGGGSAGSDPVQVKNIDGIQPVKATVTTTPFGAYDGSSLSGTSVGERNIVITMGLNPDWAIQTMEELRQQLYAYFMPKLPVRLRFTSTHLPDCQIDGVVESMEPNMFSKDPEMQISIICPAPDFLAVNPTSVSGGTSDGSSQTPVDYIGSQPTGFYLKITEDIGPSGEDDITLVLRSAGVPRVFNTLGTVAGSTYFEMSSVKGDKYSRSVNSSGIVTNYLNSVAIDAVWPELLPSDNTLAIVTPVWSQAWELTYFARFGGL